MLRRTGLYLSRERNIVDQVKNIAPKFQEGLKAYSDSPIIGEVLLYYDYHCSFKYCYFLVFKWMYVMKIDFAPTDLIMQIRGTGLILGTEFTDNKSPNQLFPTEWGKFSFCNPFLQ